MSDDPQESKPGQMECYICGKLFDPDPERVKAWGESGEDFEPTDWECPDCDALEWQFLDDDDFEVDWDEVEEVDDCDVCPGCGEYGALCDAGADEDDGLIDSVTDAQIEDADHDTADPDQPF